MKRLGQLVALVLVGILVAICTYRVESGSMAVVFRFGAVREAVGPGLHFRLPWPVETVTLVAVAGTGGVSSVEEAEWTVSRRSG